MSRLIRESAQPEGMPLSVKLKEQLELDKQKADFFARGGKINGIAPGASGVAPPKQWHLRAETIDKLKGTLGLTEAAVYSKTSKRMINYSISHGAGPEFVMVDKIRRFSKAGLDAWVKQRAAA